MNQPMGSYGQSVADFMDHLKLVKAGYPCAKKNAYKQLMGRYINLVRTGSSSRPKAVEWAYSRA